MVLLPVFMLLLLRRRAWMYPLFPQNRKKCADISGRLDELLRAVEGVERLLILPHNDPDPDALASALALRYLLANRLGRDVPIVYRGIIGRAENKALVRYLGRPLRRLTAAELRDAGGIALVDTQPGTGNNALPAGQVPLLVFDHHPWRSETAAAPFADVRPEVGATTTILASYLAEAGLEPDVPLATALFYGIKTDTLGLLRAASPLDMEIYYNLQRKIDVEALAEIENAQVPADYFQRLDAALHTARVYDGVVLSYIGTMAHSDMVAELADLLLRLEGTRWAVCMGHFKDELIVSVRSRHPRGGAGGLVQSIIGSDGTAGGHGTMAAGHLPLSGRDPEELVRQLSRELLYTLGVRDEGQPLLGSQE